VSRKGCDYSECSVSGPFPGFPADLVLWGVLILVSQPEFGFKTRFFNWVLAGFCFFFFFLHFMVAV
jgi:uncharacterized membrane protein YphA (DoxX/SURF4 family)